MADKEKIKAKLSVLETIVWVLIVLSLLFGILVSCAPNGEYGYEYNTKQADSAKIEKELGSLMKLGYIKTEHFDEIGHSGTATYTIHAWVHRETGVVYLVHSDGYMIPMYNPDGTLYVKER